MNRTEIPMRKRDLEAIRILRRAPLPAKQEESVPTNVRAAAPEDRMASIFLAIMTATASTSTSTSTIDTTVTVTTMTVDTSTTVTIDTIFVTTNSTATSTFGTAVAITLTTTTIISTLPEPIFYAACASNNLVSTVNVQYINGQYINGLEFSGNNPQIQLPSSNPYDYCVACLLSTKTPPCGATAFSAPFGGQGR
ncbi:hypothetical protein ABVK25_006736 [Lepraria finkii]|uniref:Uncharacterized protein n=1 Tax=Lepraria finkii TaxID=1340010 RepID=A0ABR4B5G5_9LECA